MAARAPYNRPLNRGQVPAIRQLMSAHWASRRGSPVTGATRWAIAALLGGVVGCLILEAAGPGSAPPGAGTGSAGQIIAVAGQLSPDSYGLYLVDLKNGTISVYQYTTKTRSPQLRLLAARNLTFDVQLDEYNTEPSPREIKKLVQQQQRLSESN